jgi:hypothetical protein
LGCSEATCPQGTICVQVDSDITATATCVGIPSACTGQPTCACMGTAAQECVKPGMPVTDATPGFLRCQDEEEGGASYLDFPCGCQ